MSLLKVLERFEQREQKYAEAALLNYAAEQLQANLAEVEKTVDAAAPQGVDAVIAAVEKADAHLPAAVFVNAALNAAKAQIEAELNALVAQGGALVPNVVAAAKAAAAKLQAEAAAL